MAWPAPGTKCGHDVICAGDAILDVAGRGGGVSFKPGGGALSAAVALATEELRVGLATVLPDDTRGRALLARVEAGGVDVGGVVLDRPRSGLVFVRGGARQVVSFGEELRPIRIPEGWSAQVLLLSAMSPVLSHGAALCRAARAARRQGTTVVVDVNARWEAWRGRDPRAVRMILREADVVWCSAQDLFGLDMSLPALRASLRSSAVLVWSDGAGSTSATGDFGEVVERRTQRALLAPLAEGETFTVAICAELAHAGGAPGSRDAMWARALRRGHAAVVERASR